MSLRARIAAVAGVAVAVAVIGTAVFTYVAVRSSLRGEIDDALAHRAQALSDFRPGALGPDRDGRLGPGPPPGPRPSEGLRPDVSQAPFGGAEGYSQFVSPAGQVFRPPDSNVTLPVSDRARSIARRGEGRYLTDTTARGTHLRVLTQATASGGAVEVARPLNEVDSQLHKILVALIIVGAVGIACGVGLGALVARTALVPISRFTRRTEKLSADPHLSQRMDVVGNDELARLARTFNSNLDALERSMEAQRHLVADASHELRTPIASLRANIQTLEDADRLPAEERARMRADIVEELDELTALVGDVVELARGAKTEEVLDDVRLDRVVTALVERARRRASDDVEFRVELEETVVRGEPERINRAVSNLLGNAAKWSPPGGRIEVTLADGVLAIRDHGPGFEAEDLPHVFERFYRAAAARAMPGSGLGLAIVQQAAESHGGFVEASNAPGGGALLRVGFGAPASVAPADQPGRAGPAEAPSRS